MELFRLFGSVLLEGSKETEQALDDIDSKGKKAGDQFTNMSKTADKASKAIVAATAAAVAGFVKMTFSTAESADQISELSKVTGLSTTTIQEMNYAAELVDVSTETMTGAMRKMIMSMGDAQKGSGDAAAAFRDLHLSVYGANGQLKNSEEMFYAVIDALGKKTNATERDALAMQIFGKNAMELNPLILSGSKSLKEYGAQAEKMGYVMGPDMIDNFNKLKDSLTIGENKIQTFKQAIALAMLPVLLALFDILNKLDPKVVAIVAIIATIAGIAVTVVVAIKKVTDVFSSFSVGTMRTTAIIVGVVAALIMLAAVIAVITGKGAELQKTMSSIGDSVGQVQGTVNRAQYNPPNYVGSYAVGTNYVPEDGLATVHKGEAIVPRKFNPAVGGLGLKTGGDTVINIEIKDPHLFNERDADRLGNLLVRHLKKFGIH